MERSNRLIARLTDSSSSTTTTNGLSFPIESSPVSGSAQVNAVPHTTAYEAERFWDSGLWSREDATKRHGRADAHPDRRGPGSPYARC
jgi:hypothetical protein